MAIHERVDDDRVSLECLSSSIFRRRLRVFVLGALLCVLLIGSTLLFNISSVVEKNATTQPTSLTPLVPPERVYESVPPHWYEEPKLVTDLRDPYVVDEEWMPVMRDANFTGIVWFHSGLSTKYRAHLDGGYQVALKPALPEDDLCDDEEYDVVRWSEYSARELRMGRKPYITRARREIQGAMEVAGFHMDRILCMMMKPPIVGRLITNHAFYRYNDTPEATRRRSLPTYHIPVGVVPWLDGLHHIHMRKDKFGLPLLMNTSMPKKDDNYDMVLSVSDSLVFDYLVDDHDRLKTQNWEYGAKLPLLIWDSGLAWVHGPKGTSLEKEQALLCGPAIWRDDMEGKDYDCPTICRFSAPLVRRIQQIVDGPGLGNMLRERVSSDYLNPVFNFAVYLLKRSHHPLEEPYSLLESDEFFDGMDVKARRFLRIVHECVDKFGASEVLLEYRNVQDSKRRCLAMPIG